MKPNWYLLTDTDGKKSLSFTMVFWTFIALTIWLILSIFESLLGLDIRAFDASGAAVWFAPICVLYWGRRGQTSVAAATDAPVVTRRVGSTPTPVQVKPVLSASEEEEAAMAADIRP